MNIEYVKDPIWVNFEHTMIDLTIKWDNMNEELPFTASPNDCEEHGRVIFAAAVAGNFGPIAEYEPPIVQQEEKVFYNNPIGPTQPSGDINVTVYE
jgi:hypothetical protein